MATSNEPTTVLIDNPEGTREDTDATWVDRAAPAYIPAAATEDQSPLHSFGSDADEDEPALIPDGRRRPRVGSDLAALVLRCAVGALLIVRGTQVLFGWFGGQGGLTLASQLERLGYQSFGAEATFVGAAEVVIGVLLVLGLLTEWACGGLLALSVVAVLAQHRMGSGVLSRPGSGIGASVQGLEVVGGLSVLAVVLALLGAGRLSLDHNRFWARAPLVTAVVALLAGAALGAALIQPQLL